MVKHAAAVSEIRQLCSLGLPGHEVMPLVLETMHQVIPSYTNLFDWVDEDGQILNYYTESPYVPEAAQLYFQEFYNKREREVIPAYSQQVCQTRGVVNYESPDRSFYRSDFYNLIWRPRGVHHSLEAVIREHGRPVGALTLYRAREDAPFSKQDEQALACLIPHLAHAVVAGADYHGQYAPSGQNGLIIIDSEGQVVYLSPEGRQLLYLAGRAVADPHAEAKDRGEPALPDALITLCRSLAGDLAGLTSPLPIFHEQNAYGRFVYRAHPLEPSNAASSRLVGIEIERHIPVSLNVVRALRTLPLSVRQRELCVLLTQGLFYGAIADRMHIGSNTVISYARVVYDKLGLGGREELVKMLLAPAVNG